MARVRFQSAGCELFTDQSSIEHLANCGGVLSSALCVAREAVIVGATPIAIGKIVEEAIRDLGGTPVLLGLEARGVDAFPSAAAVSVNEIAVNGVPGSREFVPGDIVTIDSACEVNGFVTDAAVTVCVGGTSDELVLAARKVLDAALAAAVPGARLSELSQSAHGCARRLGVDLADEAVAHGLGRSLHSAPAVFWDSVEPESLGTLQVGMVLAIEPVVIEPGDGAAGRVRRCTTEADGWSRRAPKRAAYEERTILVTEAGYRVLTPIPADGPFGA